MSGESQNAELTSRIGDGLKKAKIVSPKDNRGSALERGRAKFSHLRVESGKNPANAAGMQFVTPALSDKMESSAADMQGPANFRSAERAPEVEMRDVHAVRRPPPLRVENIDAKKPSFSLGTINERVEPQLQAPGQIHLAPKRSPVIAVNMVSPAAKRELGPSFDQSPGLTGEMRADVSMVQEPP